jgi:hypothetical protein
MQKKKNGGHRYNRKPGKPRKQAKMQWKFWYSNLDEQKPVWTALQEITWHSAAFFNFRQLGLKPLSVEKRLPKISLFSAARAGHWKLTSQGWPLKIRVFFTLRIPGPFLFLNMSPLGHALSSVTHVPPPNPHGPWPLCPAAAPLGPRPASTHLRSVVCASRADYRLIVILETVNSCSFRYRMQWFE